MLVGTPARQRRRNSIVKRVLVIQKTSLYGQLLASKDVSHIEQVFRHDEALQARYASAHEDNARTMETVHEALLNAGLAFEAHARPDIPPTENFDLVVTVGGDGTFLDASHSVKNVPMLGVNSSLSSSVGHFCCSHVHNFAETLKKIMSGDMRPRLRYRLQVEVNEKVLPIFPLNEVLFTHQIPAGTTRYRLMIGDKEEAHKSSGIWISTASGSTGAIMSAGGTPHTQPDKALQYLVREPYIRGANAPELLRGYSEDPIQIYSTSSHGAIFIDGPGERLDLDFGAKIVFRPGAAALPAFVAEPETK